MLVGSVSIPYCANHNSLVTRLIVEALFILFLFCNTAQPAEHSRKWNKMVMLHAFP